MNKPFLIILAAVAVAASASPQPRLTGGTPVTIEEFPYIVAYVYFYPGPGIFVQRCVGSLISSFHVLTTAFCFSGANLNMLIRAGSAHSLQGGILSIIDSVTLHPEYAQAPRKNDIAVTTLSFPLSPSSTIGILYLPPQNWYIPDGQTVQVVSWGFLSESGPQNNYLSTVDLNKLPLDDCKFYYSGSQDVTIDDQSTKGNPPNRRRGRSRSHSRKNISRDKAKSLSPVSIMSKVKMKSRTLELTKQRRNVLSTAELKIGNRKMSRVVRSRKYNHMPSDKNREYLERLLNRNVNVCYMTNLRDCIEKLKATYNCEQYQCPSLQERLYKHRLHHHPEYFHKQVLGSQGNQAQTKITLADLGNVTISIETKAMSTSTPKIELTGNGNFMNNNDDDSRKKYNFEIEEELKLWLTKIPFHPNETKDDIKTKHESVRRLIDEINRLKKESKNIGYEEKTKEAIDQCLNELQIWYPGPKRDQETFKEGLRENLNERIKTINRKFFNETTSNEKKGDHGSTSSNKQEGDIVDGIINNDKDGKTSIRYASKSFDHYTIDNQKVLPVSNTVKDTYYNDEVRNRIKDYQESGLDDNVTNTSNTNRQNDNSGEIKKDQTTTKVKEYYSTAKGESAGQDPNLFKVTPTDGYNKSESRTNNTNSSARKSKHDYIEKKSQENKNYNYNGNSRNERPPRTNSGKKNKHNSTQSQGNHLEQISDDYDYDKLDSNYESEKNDQKGNNDTFNKTKIKAKPEEFGKTKKYKEKNNYSNRDLINDSNDFNEEKNRRQKPVEDNKHCLSSESDLKVKRYQNRKHKNETNYSEPNMKCTIGSEDLCACSGEKNKPKKKKTQCGPKKIDMEEELAEWLRSSTIVKNDALIGKREVIDSLILHLGPYINKPAEKLNKAAVKSRIVSILKELGVCTATSLCGKSYLNNISEDLACRLIGIKSRLECTGGKNWRCGRIARKPFKNLEQVVIGPNEVFRKDLKHDFMEMIKQCLSNTALEGNIDVEEEISDELIEKVELIRRDIIESVTRNIKDILNDEDILHKDDIINIANCIMRGAKEKVTFINNINNRTNFNTVLSVQPVQSGILSIYTSEHEIKHTFNPNPKKIDRFKLNEEEKAYLDFLHNYVNEWIQRVILTSIGIENRQITELMVNELVEEIFDYMKWERWEASSSAEKLSCLSFYIYKWLLKFNIFDDFQNAESHVHELIRELRQTETPHFNKPRNKCHDSKSESSVVSDSSSLSNSCLKKKNLENTVSVWLNELPSDIYKPNDRHNEHIKKIADKIWPKLNKKTDNIVIKDVKEWLKKLLKLEAKKKVDTLSESLVEKIKQQCNSSNSALSDNIKTQKIQETLLETKNDTEEEIDATMRKLIMKYIEHNCETDDFLTKGAYTQILISVLLKLCPKKQKELISLDLLPPGSLFRQFEYITDVSDWLKNLPINSSFNTLGNKNRINFVIKLAEEISDIEKQQKLSPTTISCNDPLKCILHQLMEQLPILPEGKENINLMIDQLMKKTGARSTNIPLTISENQDLNIPDIIEQYLKTNRKEIVNEELTLELWSACILKEIKKMLTKINNSDPNYRETSATIKLPPGDELVERFNSQLEYAYEISDWIKNLSIIGPVEAVNISDLADKMVAHDIKILNDNDLAKYIEQWIVNLPLDTQRSINVALLIKQVINRKNKLSKMSDRPQTGDEKKKTAKSSKLLKSELSDSCKYETSGYILVKVIENWCQNLPFEGTDDAVNKIKCDIADKLYQKISELNDNPRYCNNMILYKASLADEIDNQLSTQTKFIERNSELSIENLKAKLLDNVQEARLLINNMEAGNSYKQKLENKIEAYFPKPAASVLKDPSFNLYKKYLSDFFILDNYDLANDILTQKYKEDMMHEIKKYTPYAFEPNASSLTRDQIYNEVYGSLYEIPLPDKQSLTDDVKEIKTETVINEWFNELPIAKPKDAKDILYRAQMIAFLAQRLCIMEKEKKSNKIMNNEIIKWLNKVPLENAQADIASEYSQSLLEHLKKLHKSQKYTKPDDKSKKSKTQFVTSSDSNYIQFNVENSNVLPSPDPTIKLVRKSGDILINIIETWCDNISLPKDMASAEAKKLKENLSRKLIMKISELNSDPNIFNEDIVYNHLLSQELDKLLHIILKNDDLNQNKDAMKNELILQINSVKQLINEERSRHEYTKDLREVINSIITDVPKEPNSEQAALYAKMREEIVDNFIEYLYGLEDSTSKKIYKEKIIEAFEKFYSKVISDSSRRHLESLKHANHIICELSKIPPPNDRAMAEQIQEFRIKCEVGNFFDRVLAPKPHVEKFFVRNMLKNSLAAELHDLEITSGYNRETKEKMKKSIERVLKKLGTTVKNSKIDDFLNKLQQSEKRRNTQPLKKNANNETVNTNKLDQLTPPKTLPADLDNPQGRLLRDSIIVESFETGSYPFLHLLKANISVNHKKSNSLEAQSKQSTDMLKAIKSNESTVFELLMMENSLASNPAADNNSVLNPGEIPNTGQSENDPNVETINPDTTQPSTSGVSPRISPTQNLNNSLHSKQHKNSLHLPESPQDQHQLLNISPSLYHLMSSGSSTEQSSQQTSSSAANSALTPDTPYPIESSRAGKRKSMQDTGVQYSATFTAIAYANSPTKSTEANTKAGISSKLDPKTKNRSISVPPDECFCDTYPPLLYRRLFCAIPLEYCDSCDDLTPCYRPLTKPFIF